MLKWFGTFQAELATIPPVYGVTRPVRTWNPILFNFQHLWLLIKDAWRANSYWDKLRIWLMPTGWRPADVEKEYPVTKIDDVFYETRGTAWALIQFLEAAEVDFAREQVSQLGRDVVGQIGDDLAHGGRHRLVGPVDALDDDEESVVHGVRGSGI